MKNKRRWFFSKNWEKKKPSKKKTTALGEKSLWKNLSIFWKKTNTFDIKLDRTLGKKLWKRKQTQLKNEKLKPLLKKKRNSIEKIKPFLKKKNLFEKNQPLQTNNRYEKKTCDNKKQNSFDIKTNPTLLGKKAKPLFSSEKSFGKKTLEKNKKKENHSLKNTSLLKTFF